MSREARSIGSTTIRIDGDERFVSLARGELGSAGVPSDAEPDIELRQAIERSDLWSQGVPGGPRLRLFPNGFHQRGRLIEIGVRFEDPIVVDVHPVRTGAVESVRRAFATGSADPWQLAFHHLFSYHHFWPLLHMAMLSNRMAFVHGAIVEGDGGVVLCGTGGSGKSTLAARLIEDHDFGYLAEDFGVVSSEGTAYLSPRRIPVYRHEISDMVDSSRQLFDRFQRTHPLSRATWAILSALGRDPLRRLEAKEVFGEERLARESRIRAGFVLVRGRDDQTRVRELDLQSFCRRAAHAALREMRPFYEIFHQSQANLGTCPFDMEELFTATEGCYREAFESVSLFLVELAGGDSRRAARTIVRSLE